MKYGFFRFFRTSWQAALSAASAQAASGDCTLIRCPPTSRFSRSQLASLGQDGSEGRTRRTERGGSAARVAVIGPGKTADSRGIAATRLSMLLLFMPNAFDGRRAQP